MLDDSFDRIGNMAPVHGSRRHSNLSNFEKNCNQIFVKAPTLTREFFEKIQNDVVPQKTDLLGYQMNTRRFIVLTGLLLLFTLSTIGTITMWFTNVFQKRIDSMMVLSEDSLSYELWRAPSLKPAVKIYIFNYTNVDKFEAGLVEKLQVEQVGPYVYYEELERVNIRFSKVDGTVSYQERRNYKFSPELSNGHTDDLIMVPNVPLLAGAAVVKNLNFFMRMSYNGLLKALSEKPFIPLKVGHFISGYDDHLYDLSKSYLKFEEKRVFEHFGILAWKEGTQPDVYTLNTGAHDITNLGQIEKFNGQTEYDMWGTDSCNRIKASDGIMYPSNLVKAKKDLEFFMPQMCRKIPLKFVEENAMLDNRVPVYRYKMPLDVFDSTSNTCYCDQASGVCPPKGFFNATTCSFGAPLFYSWPHFYGAEPDVREAINGLDENPLVNDTFLDVHPKFGSLMRGKIKLQVNVRVEKSFGLSELSSYTDGLMLPLVWVETGLEDKDLTDDVVNLIYQMTFTIKNVELGLKYGCLLATMVTLTCILLVLKKHRQSRSRDNSRPPFDLIDS